MNERIANESGFKEALSLLLTNQQQIHENIKFADAKALVFSAINTALLGAIFGLKSIPNGSWLYVATLICADLVIGIAFALLREACSNTDAPTLLAQTQTFIFDRATIDHKKYSWLNRSIWVSAFGWLAAIIFLAFLK